MVKNTEKSLLGNRRRNVVSLVIHNNSSFLAHLSATTCPQMTTAAVLQPSGHLVTTANCLDRDSKRMHRPGVSELFFHVTL